MKEEEKKEIKVSTQNHKSARKSILSGELTPNNWRIKNGMSPIDSSHMNKKYINKE